ncbi:hypothetical protein KDN34_07840 [Shewanella yunxiaonensis]|uniref:Uncharacterized protein n=1 Tax=Shewanella yunxiaonensis TaxID=2829809 RepID=A0ABX7YX99_9GAMM|nr:MULTISPECIES: hypothetical protein [Shewanella]MDF0535481.1 hypothetical protein [Shewanella sp. A32]QUN07312.1 hypothetical protein KDN34_07840 [Shewanella yunxiaonensis]
MLLGDPQAPNIIYLPHSPVVPEQWHWQQRDAATEIIGVNSNHWRKILVIAAKIFAPTDDWKSFLQNNLFNIVCLVTEPIAWYPSTGTQLISGKEVCASLGVKVDTAVPLANAACLRQLRQNIWLVPYLDYRQFSNQTVEQLRLQLFNR